MAVKIYTYMDVIDSMLQTSLVSVLSETFIPASGTRQWYVRFFVHG